MLLFRRMVSGDGNLNAGFYLLLSHFMVQANNPLKLKRITEGPCRQVMNPGLNSSKLYRFPGSLVGY